MAERKIQEEKIKQIESKHSKQLQEKDSLIQEKDNKLKMVAQQLLKNGMPKEHFHRSSRNLSTVPEHLFWG